MLISACGGSGSDAPPPPPPSLNVDTTSIEAGAPGESVSVDVSNGGGGTLNWTAAIPDGVDWARISSGSSGSNSGTIQIEIDPNRGAGREFELTVSAGAAGSSTVAVTQADGRPAIELAVESTELDGEGGMISLQVRNRGIVPMQWRASLPDALDDELGWAYIRSGGEGTDAGEVVIRYRLNGGNDRELEVRVTAPDAINSPQSLTLSQEWFASSACTYPEARGEFLELMKRWYYFNDEPEQVARYDGLDIEDYPSLDSLLDALRLKPLDFIASTWAPAPDPEFYGFGFDGRTVVGIPDFRPIHYLVVDVYAGTPAADANLERGDRIVGLNGTPLPEMAWARHVLDEFGPNEEGFEVTFDIEKPSGERRTFSMAKALFELPSVPEEQVRIFDTDAGKVGYLLIRRLQGDADMRLLEEFAEFNAAGVKSLIVDMRYNYGGLLRTGNGLATLIGGPELFENGTQTVLSRRFHNELLRSEGHDTTVYFGCGAFPTPDMAARCESESSIRELENVVFITYVTTLAASELVIAALQPHENVTVVGARTLGVPVGRYQLGFCMADQDAPGTRRADLWPASFAHVNADGFRDYWNGILPSQGCSFFEEDLSRQLGDPEESWLAAALRYLETGSCGAPASAQVARGQETTRTVLPPDSARFRFRGH